MTSRFITAVGTPLTQDEQLHEAGLEAHLADQAAAGVHGILVAGTMGLLQLQSDATYRRLVERSAALWKGRGELLVGAGDASLIRSRERIEYINRFDVDGVAVLAPYFIRFPQPELIDYYTALADASRAPIFLYDLPQRTHSKLEVETVLELAKHPNIRGIKCSDVIDWTRGLIKALRGHSSEKVRQFRVIVAQPLMIDTLIHEGIHEHLDGAWTIAPDWATKIGRLADAGQWEAAAQQQQQFSRLVKLFGQYGLPMMSVLLNARGIPGTYTPRPYRPLTRDVIERLMAEDVVRELLGRGAKSEELLAAAGR